MIFTIKVQSNRKTALFITLTALFLFSGCYNETKVDYEEEVITNIALSPEYNAYRKAFRNLTKVNADMQAIIDVRNTGKYDDDEPLPVSVLEKIEGGVEYQNMQFAWDKAYNILTEKYPYKGLSKEDKKRVKELYYLKVTVKPIIVPPVVGSNQLK